MASNSTSGTGRDFPGRKNTSFRLAAGLAKRGGGDGAKPKGENARATAAMWGGADSFEKSAHVAG